MTHARDILESSYAECRRQSVRAGSNFHAGFMLLPREKRRAMEALYAFMRHTDDLADAPAASDEARRNAIRNWRAALEQAANDEAGKRGQPPFVHSALRAIPAGADQRLVGDCPLLPAPSTTLDSHAVAILPALIDSVRRFQIPLEHLTAVIDGVEMDIEPPRYETFDDLQIYCERVASAVGLACIHIWGFRGPEAFEPARKAGVALQLTNILRDLKEDARKGRIYLPLADFRACDCPVEDLLDGAVGEPLFRVMRLEIDRAWQYFRQSAELIDWLDPQGRRIFGLMMSTYGALLQIIAQNPAQVFRRRIRLSGIKKFGLFVRWSLLPPRKEALR